MDFLVPDPISVNEYVRSEMPLTRENENAGRIYTTDIDVHGNEIPRENIKILRSVPIVSLRAPSEDDHQTESRPTFGEEASSSVNTRRNRTSRRDRLSKGKRLAKPLEKDTRRSHTLKKRKRFVKRSRKDSRSRLKNAKVLS